MKATGIVRRIDELGRVVIPKEIRKTLRLRVGDPLEIYTDSGELLLKKYSPINSLESFSKDLCEAINLQTGKTVLICDMDEVLHSKGQSCKDFDKKRISLELEKTILMRKTVKNCAQDGDSLTAITDFDPSGFTSELIVPILCQGDALGAIVLLSKNDKITQEDVSVCKFCEDFLQRQFS